jgi:esterase
VTFDARNHGDSPHVNGMGYDEMANDILELAKNLGFKKFSLLGHSMGGRAVMAFALSHPDQIEKLVVVDVSPFSMGADIKEMKGITFFNLPFCLHSCT